MAARYRQCHATTGENTAAVCRWLTSQVRRLMKRVELLEHPRLAVRAEMLAELARQRTEGERLAGEAAQCVAVGKAAVKQAERLAGTKERVLALHTEMSEKGEPTTVMSSRSTTLPCSSSSPSCRRPLSRCAWPALKTWTTARTSQLKVAKHATTVPETVLVTLLKSFGDDGEKGDCDSLGDKACLSASSVHLPVGDHETSCKVRSRVAALPTVLDSRVTKSKEHL